MENSETKVALKRLRHTNEELAKLKSKQYHLKQNLMLIREESKD